MVSFTRTFYTDKWANFLDELVTLITKRKPFKIVIDKQVQIIIKVHQSHNLHSIPILYLISEQSGGQIHIEIYSKILNCRVIFYIYKVKY